MQLKQVSRDALLKPLQAVSGIVERRQTLPILANVLLEQKNGRLFVTATDLEMQITANRKGADRKSTRLNSSHVAISYAVFCLEKERAWRAFFRLVSASSYCSSFTRVRPRLYSASKEFGFISAA